VLGHWFEGLKYGEVYYIPAVLGCLALLVLVVDGIKTCACVCGTGSATPEAPQARGPETG
jgi:hypothetical protein